MYMPRRRPFGQRYAFIVAGVIFFSLLASAGMRSAPGVLILPLEGAFGWSRQLTSSSAALGIFLYGLVGPFAAALMQSVGVRRTLLGGLAGMSLAAFLSGFMTQPWQYLATWGLMSGLSSGCVALVLGATVVNRWFIRDRGLIMGFLTASTATGTLLFVPGLAALAEWGGWRPVVWALALCTAAMLPLVAWLLPETPSHAGLLPYGATSPVPPPPPRLNPVRSAFQILGQAMRVRTFWILAGTFFICGATTNGLVGTHMIALCADHGLPEVQAASLLAVMGVFDLFGTTGSGWLSDRFDPRKLLFMYYALRGVALIYLPFADFSFYGLSLFAIFFGLDWIATVPPTLRLIGESFGDQRAPVVFGWVVAGHQLGAATASFVAGYMRTVEGTYLQAFVLAGTVGLVAAVLALTVRRQPQTTRLA